MVIVILILVFLVVGGALGGAEHLQKLDKIAKGPLGDNHKWYSTSRGVHTGETHWKWCADTDNCERLGP